MVAVTGEEFLVFLHSEQEVCHFLNGGFEGFALAVQIRICVYGDLGVFLDAINLISDTVEDYISMYADQGYRFDSGMEMGGM